MKDKYSFVRATVARGAPPSSLTLRPADEFQEKIVRTTLLSALLLGASAYALPASAETDPPSITVQSTIPPYCSELSMQDVTLDLGTLTDVNGKLVSQFAGDDTRELASSFYCNAPTKVKIEADPLMNDIVTTVDDDQSFTNRVDYTAKLTWANVTGDLSVSSTVDDGTEFDIPQAQIGTMAIEISQPDVTGNLRPVAGGYTGAVRLTISLAQ